jgi:uncharacterized membrane protein YgcG
MYMNHTQKGVAEIALIIIVAIALLTGGTYVYTKVRQDDRATDAVLIKAQRSLERSSRPASEVAAELARVRTSLQVEVDKLELFRSTSFNKTSSYGWALALIQKEISDAVLSKTEDIFKIASIAGIDPAMKISLTQDRQQLIALVDAWQALYNKPSGVSQAAVSDALQAVLDAAHDYVESLATAVNSLTPANTNTTPETIQTQQAIVTTVTQTVQHITTTVDTTTPDQGDVQDIQENIQNLEEELVNTSTPPSGNTTGTTGGSSGTTGGTTNTTTGGSGTGGGTSGNTATSTYTPPPYVPPPVVDTSGRPQLIQGSNPF